MTIASVFFRIDGRVRFLRDQLHRAVRISGWMVWRFFHTIVGIVSSPGAEDGGIALIATRTSSGVTGLKSRRSFEGVWGSHPGGGGKRCSRSTLAFSSKVVAPLMVARLGGGLGKAFLTVFHKLAGEVVSTIVFQWSLAAFLTARR